MLTDAELLQRYADEKSEAAFAELVRRHINLVYAAALRQVDGETQAAEDVAQAVFTDLARKAASVAKREVVASWLYTSTRFAAANARRARGRRRKYEKEAETMHAAEHEPAENLPWESLSPLIDEVVHELSERDRAAVLLRFFENRAFTEIGRVLNLSEDAARMRVERALDKLQAALRRRGVTSTATALGLALGHHAAGAAPLGLATSVASGAVVAAASASVAGTATATLISMSTTKTALALAGAALVAMIGTTVMNHRIRTAEEAELLAARYRYASAAARRSEMASPTRLPVLASLTARSASTAATVSTSKAVSPASSMSTPNRIAEGDKFMAQHPEVKEALQAWATAIITSRWGAFFREEHLKPEQIAEFQKLMRTLNYMTGVEENGRAMMLVSGLRLSDVEQQRRLRELLGVETYSRYQAFERSLPARDFAARVAGALCYSETPLTPEQNRQLVRVLEAVRVPDSAGAAHQFDWDRVVKEAAAMLSPGQLAAVERMRAVDEYNLAWNRELDGNARNRGTDDAN